MSEHTNVTIIVTFIAINNTIIVFIIFIIIIIVSLNVVLVINRVGLGRVQTKSREMRRPNTTKLHSLITLLKRWWTSTASWEPLLQRSFARTDERRRWKCHQRNHDPQTRGE